MIPKNHKALLGTVFNLIVMVIILLLAYTFLSGFVSSMMEELTSLKDLRDEVQLACRHAQDYTSTMALELPAGEFQLLLKPEGFVALKKTGSGKLTKKPLDCSENIEFKSCTIGPTPEGAESFNLTIKKAWDDAYHANVISLEGELVKCD